MKTPTATATILGFLLLAAPLAMAAQSTKVADIFLDKCANCHGKDGAGQTVKGKKLKLKDLKSAEAQKMTDVQMIELFTKGKGDMQSYAKELDAQQMKDMVAYLRSLAKK